MSTPKKYILPQAGSASGTESRPTNVGCPTDSGGRGHLGAYINSGGKPGHSGKLLSIAVNHYIAD